MLKEMDVQETFTRFRQFARLPAEKKLLHFDFYAPKMCSDEWRAKLKKFLQDGSKISQELIDEVFAHLQLDIFEGDQATTACKGCREAFWQLIWLSTDVDGH